jgi:hypothetical protein
VDTVYYYQSKASDSGVVSPYHMALPDRSDMNMVYPDDVSLVFSHRVSLRAFYWKHIFLTKDLLQFEA